MRYDLKRFYVHILISRMLFPANNQQAMCTNTNQNIIKIY